DEYQGLSRGTVESYAIDSSSGRLTLLHCQPLSLSATRPRHLAISPDGRHALIIKEVGCGEDPEHQASAHPHSVLFHRSGHYVIGSDFGSDRLNVFTWEDGQLIRRGRTLTQPAKG